MTEPSLVLVDLSNEVLEHALAHAEQPTRHCHICANGSPIRAEDYDLAIKARLYNARQLMDSMIRHLSRLQYPQVSLGALYQLIHEAALLQTAKTGESVVVTERM
jgi:hypothetical protein